MADFAIPSAFVNWRASARDKVLNTDLDTFFGYFSTERNATSSERFKNNWRGKIFEIAALSSEVYDFYFPGTEPNGIPPFMVVVDGVDYTGTGNPLAVTEISLGKLTLRNLHATETVRGTIQYLNNVQWVYASIPYVPAPGVSFEADRHLRDGNYSGSDPAHDNSRFVTSRINDQRSLARCWYRTPTAGFTTIGAGATVNIAHTLGYIPHVVKLVHSDASLTAGSATIVPCAIENVTATDFRVRNFNPGTAFDVAIHYRGGMPSETNPPADFAFKHLSTGNWANNLDFLSKQLAENWSDLMVDLHFGPSKRFVANQQGQGVAATVPGNNATLSHALGYRPFTVCCIDAGTVSNYDPMICTAFGTSSVTYKNVGTNNMDVTYLYWD